MPTAAINVASKSSNAMVELETLLKIERRQLLKLTMKLDYDCLRICFIVHYRF